MPMRSEENKIFMCNQQTYHCHLINPIHPPKGVVLIFPDWSGLSHLAKQTALSYAEIGFVTMAIDVYGEGRTGVTREQKMALIQPLLGNRLELLNRCRAATAFAKEHYPELKIGAIGYCFGGLCVLDMARAGIDIEAIISVHGLLNQDPNSVHPSNNENITAKLLVLHGDADPMVPPTDVSTFCQEMRAANADWQLHIFGNVKHAFTNPAAADLDAGTVFDANAASSSFRMISAFLTQHLCNA